MIDLYMDMVLDDMEESYVNLLVQLKLPEETERERFHYFQKCRRYIKHCLAMKKNGFDDTSSEAWKSLIVKGQLAEIDWDYFHEQLQAAGFNTWQEGLESYKNNSA